MRSQRIIEWIHGDLMAITLEYTPWLCQNSYCLNGPVEIVDLPIDSIVIFQFAM